MSCEAPGRSVSEPWSPAGSEASGSCLSVSSSEAEDAPGPRTEGKSRQRRRAARVSVCVVPRRSKVSQACDKCRGKKIRCDLAAPGATCKSCQRLNLLCTFKRVQMKRGPAKRTRARSLDAPTARPPDDAAPAASASAPADAAEDGARLPGVDQLLAHVPGQPCYVYGGSPAMPPLPVPIAAAPVPAVIVAASAAPLARPAAHMLPHAPASLTHPSDGTPPFPVRQH